MSDANLAGAGETPTAPAPPILVARADGTFEIRWPRPATITVDAALFEALITEVNAHRRTRAAEQATASAAAPSSTPAG